MDSYAACRLSGGGWRGPWGFSMLKDEELSPADDADDGERREQNVRDDGKGQDVLCEETTVT